LAITLDGGDTSVVVLPITHSQPGPDQSSLEIPIDTKRRLGLDDDRSWILFSEANHFDWTGFDLRPRKPGDVSSIAYGELPANFFRVVRAEFARAVREKRLRMAPRS